MTMQRILTPQSIEAPCLSIQTCGVPMGRLASVARQAYPGAATFRLSCRKAGKAPTFTAQRFRFGCEADVAGPATRSTRSLVTPFGPGDVDRHPARRAIDS